MINVANFLIVSITDFDKLILDLNITLNSNDSVYLLTYLFINLLAYIIIYLFIKTLYVTYTMLFSRKKRFVI